MLPGGQLLFVNSNLHRFNKSQITQAGIETGPCEAESLCDAQVLSQKA